MSFPFSVGDIIEVRAGVSNYTITTPGTLLEIIHIGTAFFEGKVIEHRLFKHYKGNTYSFSDRELKNFKLVTPLDTSDVNYKHRQVILKIRDMDKRRKESGYAY